MDTVILSAVSGLEDLVRWFLTAQAPYEGGWRMHPMWTWGRGVFMMAMVFLVSGVVIYAGMMGFHWFIGRDQRQPTDSAMEILREKFARGEIDKDEFEAKKKALAK